MSSDVEILTVCDPDNVTVRDLQLTVRAKSITFDIEEDSDDVISTSITFDMTCPDHFLALKNLIEILTLQVKNHEGHCHFYQSESTKNPAASGTNFIQCHTRTICPRCKSESLMVSQIERMPNGATPIKEEGDDVKAIK